MSLFSNVISLVARNTIACKNVIILSKNCTKISRYRYNSTKSRTTNTLKGMFKIGLAGVTVGAVVGTGYSIHYFNKPRSHILNEQTVINPIDTIPDFTPSRSIKNAGDTTGLQLTLFQYQTCPFCCKVRAFLDYYGISYDIIEVDPVLRQAIKWSPYKKVPILVAKTEDGYQPMNDSTMIISALATFIKDSQKNLSEIVSYFPFISFTDDDGKKKTEIMNRYFLMMSNPSLKVLQEKEANEERKWRKWADDVLVHMLSPNVYRTREEALQAFNWFSEVGEWEKNFPAWERNVMIYVGATAMYFIGKRLKRRHHLKDDVRQSLYDECNRWVRAVNAKGTPFMGGHRPNLADLAIYGVLNSIEGCLAFKDLLDNTTINKWYLSMKDAVSQHQGAQFI